MKGFGKVDFVIADVGQDGVISQFLSVELQAIDITGSVAKSYEALVDGKESVEVHSRGFNWDNVYKRYVTQLIRKGYFHHHWGSKIVAVIPDQVYEYVVSRASFMTTTDVKAQESNIVFVTYALVANDSTSSSAYRPEMVRCVATSHSALQQAMMYAIAPDKSEFTKRIRHSLTNEIRLADLIKAGDFEDDDVVVEGSGGDHLNDLLL